MKAVKEQGQAIGKGMTRDSQGNMEAHGTNEQGRQLHRTLSARGGLERTMWLREYTSLSPVRTNHRLCQVCRLEPHFIRYPEIMTLEVSMDPGCFVGEAVS